MATERGLLDTNILTHWEGLEPTDLPRRAAVSAITFAELSAGVLAATDDVERSKRADLLRRVESTFDPIPFDGAAARAFGTIAAAVRVRGRSPRSRVPDLMIAAIAAAHGLPLYTTNPADFDGLGEVVEVIPVARPA